MRAETAFLAADALFFDAVFRDAVFFAATCFETARFETAGFGVAGFDAVFFAAARFVADGVFAATVRLAAFLAAGLLRLETVLAVFRVPLVAAVLRVPEDFAVGFAFVVFLVVVLLAVPLRLLAGERFADADAGDLRSAALLRAVVAVLRDTARFSGVVK